MISDRIKMVRERNGLSQTEFGARLGISRDVVNNIENNRLKRPEQQTPIYKLVCKEFGVDEHWLLTGEGSMIALQTDAERLSAWIAKHARNESDEFKRRFIAALVDLSDEDWKVIQRFVESMNKTPDA